MITDQALQMVEVHWKALQTIHPDDPRWAIRQYHHLVRMDYWDRLYQTLSGMASVVDSVMNSVMKEELSDSEDTSDV